MHGAGTRPTRSVFDRNEPCLSTPPKMRSPAVILLLACMAVFAPGAAAQPVETPVAFTVTFRGLSVAEISGTARETEDAYAAAVQIRATGLVSTFARVRFDMAVEGFRDGDRLSPYRYRDNVDTGQRRGAVDLLWSAGSGPVLLSPPPEVEPGVIAVQPDAANGVQDRLTLLWRLARPQPDTALCNWQATMFDGARLASFTIAAPRIDGASATCDGVYSRLAGYPEAELSNAARFPFDVTYRRTATGLWELTGASGASIYGPVRIFIRD